MKKSIIIVALALSLQSCIFVAGTAIGAAAIAGVYDHRKIEKTLDDAKIANAVINKIRSNPGMRNESHIEVSAFNHMVLLTGQTPNPAWRMQVDELARSVPEVDRVYNQITIQGPTSSLTRTSDSWITAKVRSLMLANKNLKSSSMKVVTENGSVYIMGIVSHEQASIAVDIARQVSGVQRVVKVFEYTD